MSDLEEQKPGVSRRTVAKAMAWSVPAVALAVPAPAYAASPGIVTLTGTGCKLPGNSNDLYKGYAFKASISNTNPVPITLTITSVTLNGTPLGNVTVVDLTNCTNLGASFVVPAQGGFPNVAIITQNGTNSQNGTLVVSYTITGGPGGSEQATANATGLGPIQGSCDAYTEDEADCINSVAT